MNILLLGGGGREHALAWKLAQSAQAGKLHAIPGNPGIAEHAQCHALLLTDHDAVVAFCAEHAIDLVVIGPEAPLVDGLGDALRAHDIRVFGPGKAAAQLEGSKGFTKDLCDRAGIPTARYVLATSEDAAIAALGSFGLPVVIKADGLAAGKGVVIAQTADEARTAITALFASDGAQAVIEEFLTGEEVSLFVLTDGTAIVPFGSAQDHKRVGEGDTGPNTGGMGAYSPARVLTAELEAAAMASIIAPTIKAMADAGMPYSGVLYAGLMLTSDGPKLIEYNCRFGDPECQVLMLRLESDLVDLLAAVADHRLATTPAPIFTPEPALTVVIAATGYPATPVSGGMIADIARAEEGGAKVFHAGTTRDESRVLRASGGRVLNVSARGPSVSAARDVAYQATDAIDYAQGFCRRDIGWREIEREREQLA